MQTQLRELLATKRIGKKCVEEVLPERSPDEEDFTAEVGVFLVDHVRSSVGNGPVQEPVGGCCDRKTLGSDLQREHFSGHDPCSHLLALIRGIISQVQGLQHSQATGPQELAKKKM